METGACVMCGGQSITFAAGLPLCHSCVCMWAGFERNGFSGVKHYTPDQVLADLRLDRLIERLTQLQPKLAQKISSAAADDGGALATLYLSAAEVNLVIQGLQHVWREAEVQ